MTIAVDMGHKATKTNKSTKIYIVGTQKNCLFEMVLLEYPKHMFKHMGKKILTIVLLFLFYCFMSQSTAMNMSVHLSTLFPGQA